MEYETELEYAINIAKEASELIMKYHDNLESIATETKNDGTPVTMADKKANELIVKRLQEKFPLDGIVSEELAKIDGKRTWYIDPIDGTKGFIKSTQGEEGDFAIHIGLVEGTSPVLGVVYKPKEGVYFYGTKDAGAYKVSNGNCEKLKIKKTKPNLILIASYDYEQKPLAVQATKLLKPVKILTSGSEGLRLMHLVENEADIRFVERKLMCGTWDVCAPHAIVEAAGGIVKYLSGKPIEYKGQRGLEDFYIATRTEEQFNYAKEKLIKILK